MSRLSLVGRPWVVFNPSDREHRKWFAEFQANHTWSKCPVRFISDDASGDLLSMIQRRLIDFYTGEEFGKKSRRRSV